MARIGPLTAHISLPLPLVVTAEALFFAGTAAALVAWWLSRKAPTHRRHVAIIGLGALGGVCLLLATSLPLLLGPGSLRRPASTARLRILAPTAGQVFTGAPAHVPVRLALDGGRIVPATTLSVTPDEGHIHLYLDGRLLLMTGLAGSVDAPPGAHELRAEFVARDHGAFDPPVVSTVAFEVDPPG